MNPALNDTYNHIVYEAGNPQPLIGRNKFNQNAPVPLGYILTIQRKRYRVVSAEIEPLAIVDQPNKPRLIEVIVTVEPVP